jgi:hypothetical protein
VKAAIFSKPKYLSLAPVGQLCGFGTRQPANLFFTYRAHLSTVLSTYPQPEYLAAFGQQKNFLGFCHSNRVRFRSQIFVCWVYKGRA